MIAEIAAGLALGALGAAGHLGVVRARVGRLVRGDPALPWQLGLAAPAAAVLLAFQTAPEAVWAVPVGLFVMRTVVLKRRTAR
jgi:hypothetical protein